VSAAAPIVATAASAPPTPARELWRDFRRNRGAVLGLVVLALLVFCALFADVIAPYAPSEQFRDAALRPPSLTPIGGHVFVLGTDPVGRDILSRLIHGTRLSLAIGIVSVGLSLVGGVENRRRKAERRLHDERSGAVRQHGVEHQARRARSGQA